jgi:eukaryotic-like serine/threonine-protein kinase
MCPESGAVPRSRSQFFDLEQDSYRSLRSIVSERTRRFVVWCGAGISRPAGLPDWVGLRIALSGALQRKALTLTPADRAAAEEITRTIALEPSPWVAFQRLQAEVGQATYLETIREALRPAATAPIPPPYNLLWRLRPAGFMSLNLDRLATRSFHEVNGSKALVEFDSTNVGAHTHVLQAPSSFLYNLHGTYENSRSWVLTHDELKLLLEDVAYRNFVRSVLSTSTVVFVGLSADDVAIGGHLSHLAASGIDTGPHYWVTSRADVATDQWAERAGIRMIRYPLVEERHVALEEMLQDLLYYIPPESPPAPPVVAHVESAMASLPPAEVLATRDSEAIRLALNSCAAAILGQDTERSFREFEEFAKAYDEAIHRAWYTSLVPGKNTLLGYTLQQEVARGAFGRVFRALAPDGTKVAIKLLHSEMREQRELLLAFRRGVRAMSLLRSRRLPGVVQYRTASEIPALVVMDWIEGANLKDAVLAKKLNSWPALLKVSRELASVIESAHAAPERILHRDIRPANIMLEGFWTGEEWSVVVLDFDLSWHREAYEQSVIHGSGTAGYLAPEQFTRIPGVSARHAAVDTFGLGMTFYFLMSGIDPVPAEHRHRDWESAVRKAADLHPCDRWQSAPSRFARLVIDATRDRQAERPDVSQVVAELLRLEQAVRDPTTVLAADMIGEEIAARSQSMADYHWDDDALAAEVGRPSGLAIHVSGDEGKRSVLIRIEWRPTGTEERKRVGKWSADVTPQAVASLKKGGWKVVVDDAGKDGVLIAAEYRLSDVPTPFDSLSSSLDKAAGVFRFE